ncbi:GTP cyclohydrolase I FolE [Ornithinibacillus sp. L9]|uniref:GTP cyclohydrolase 1 n=1 Tax=Ornithinibacillus caprae TaxID=2678566 RepID=A0A6N8FDQ8_9BACI|nr:GTP cyclohydrolase I FolE [Ornithinibacillus caprae]MUK87673.1 GTP cyclohydrolase I FolE [Ornithinibacillus caprae]
MAQSKQEKIKKAVEMILEAIGEDTNREGILETPNRVATMYEEIFSGMNVDPRDYFTSSFCEEHEELILVKDIDFHSVCEHHLIPFFGKAHVAYIPQNGQVTGIGNFAKAIEAVAKRPQIQERMTTTLANAIEETLSPRGVLVVIEAEHLCMTMRGVKKPGSQTVTTAARGVFEKDSAKRAEVLSFIRR